MIQQSASYKYEKSPETLWLKGLALRVKATQELPRAILKAPPASVPYPPATGEACHVSATQQGPGRALMSKLCSKLNSHHSPESPHPGL